MDHILKEERREMKKLKQHCDMLDYVALGEFGIPTSCPCGGSIVDEVSANEAKDFLPGKRFFKCNVYKADGLHYRQPWVLGVQEEIGWVNRRVEKLENSSWRFELFDLEIKKLKEANQTLTRKLDELQRLREPGN